MSIRYTVDENIIKKAISKLKNDNGISQDAYFVPNSYDSYRKDVLYHDLDFQFFLGNRIPTNQLMEYQNEIEIFMARYKKFGRVSQDAYFDYNTPEKLRNQILYRDGYFLNCLGEDFEEEIIDSVLEMLREKEFVNFDAIYDKQKFINLRKEIKNRFQVPSTAMTPVMERLLYMLSSINQPRKMIGIGIYCGYTLVWNAGPSCGDGKVYNGESILGIDIDEKSINIAKDNFSKLQNNEHIKLIAEDGCSFADNVEEVFDYIYLDVDGKELGKGLNLIILKKLYEKLRPGGWVLTHDTTHPYFQEQFKDYLQFVRDKANFSESISFDVDLFGLELSIK